MKRLPYKISMLFTSFIPLWLCFGIKYILYPVGFQTQNNRTAGWLLATIFSSVLLFLSIIAAFIVFLTIKYVKAEKNIVLQPVIKVEKIRLSRKINIEYLFGFILPLLVFDLNCWVDTVCFSVIFITFAILYIRFNITYINPVLAVCGYKIYTARVISGCNEEHVTLIYKGAYKDFDPHSLRIVFIGQDYGFVAKDITE